MTDIRSLLSTAAGSPDPQDLLTRVRRVAVRRTRLRRGATGLVVLLLAGGVGTGSVLVAQPGRRVEPAVLAPATPSPTEAPVVTSSPAAPITTPALCTRADLTVGTPTGVHVLAGEDGIDLPVTARSGCTLSLGGFGFTPDAAVPVSRSARRPLGLAAGATAHLVLTGESDGFCVTVPDAHSVTVTFQGSRLAVASIPNLGLCTQITADLQPEQDHGEETSCTAAHLDARASLTSDGDVEVVLRNNADYDCFLQGTPSAAAGITATGRVVDLGITGGVVNSLSLEPGAQAQIDVGGPPTPGCLKPTGSTTFTSLRLTLLNAGGAEVTATPPRSFSFACDQGSINAYELAPTPSATP